MGFKNKDLKVVFKDQSPMAMFLNQITYRLLNRNNKQKTSDNE